LTRDFVTTRFLLIPGVNDNTIPLAAKWLAKKGKNMPDFNFFKETTRFTNGKEETVIYALYL
jgi:hypothetical protein